MPYTKIDDMDDMLPHFERDMVIALLDIKTGNFDPTSPRYSGKTLRGLIRRGAVLCPRNPEGNRRRYDADRAKLTEFGDAFLDAAAARYVAAAEARDRELSERERRHRRARHRLAA